MAGKNPIVKEWEVRERELKAKAAESFALGEGLKVGKIFREPVADGYAWYEVIEIAKRGIIIRWMSEFSPDGYQSVILGEGGRFSRAIIEKLVNCYYDVQRLFQNQK